MSASQPSRFAPSPSQSRPRHEFVFEPLLDSDEAAELLRIHPKTLQRMARNRQIHGIQVGKLWRFRASDLEIWLKTKKAGWPAFSNRYLPSTRHSTCAKLRQPSVSPQPKWRK